MVGCFHKVATIIPLPVSHLSRGEFTIPPTERRSLFPHHWGPGWAVTQFDHENMDEVLCASSQSRLKRPCVLHLHYWEQ